MVLDQIAHNTFLRRMMRCPAGRTKVIRYHIANDKARNCKIWSHQRGAHPRRMRLFAMQSQPARPIVCWCPGGHMQVMRGGDIPADLHRRPATEQCCRCDWRSRVTAPWPIMFRHVRWWRVGISPAQEEVSCMSCSWRERLCSNEIPGLPYIVSPNEADLSPPHSIRRELASTTADLWNG
jgi:hypothetical protein